jgi:hypothetical protein
MAGRLNRPEDQIQRSVVQALTLARVHFFPVPNGGKRSRLEAAIMVGLGVKAGVPDIIITSRLPNFPHARGGALEIKAPGKKATDKQAEWIETLRGDGWEAEVGVGAPECFGWLRKWGLVY